MHQFKQVLSFFFLLKDVVKLLIDGNYGYFSENWEAFHTLNEKAVSFVTLALIYCAMGLFWIINLNQNVV